MVDTGTGVSRVYKVPRSTTGFPFDFSIPNPQVTYLSDSQDNFAWAVFGRSASTSATSGTRRSRCATTRTRASRRPRRRRASFRPRSPATSSRGRSARRPGTRCSRSSRCAGGRPTTVTLYGDLSRGFRSGGFNQSGVALAGVAGVFNTFDEQIADTIEVGMKTQFANDRVSTNARVLRHGPVGRVLLHLPRRVEHAELGQPRRGRVQRRRVRAERALDRQLDR